MPVKSIREMARQHLTVEADPAQDILRRAEQTGTDLIVLQSGMRKGRIFTQNRKPCRMFCVGNLKEAK